MLYHCGCCYLFILYIFSLFILTVHLLFNCSVFCFRERTVVTTYTVINYKKIKNLHPFKNLITFTFKLSSNTPTLFFMLHRNLSVRSFRKLSGPLWTIQAPSPLSRTPKCLLMASSISPLTSGLKKAF